MTIKSTNSLDSFEHEINDLRHKFFKDDAVIPSCLAKVCDRAVKETCGQVSAGSETRAELAMILMDMEMLGATNGTR